LRERTFGAPQSTATQIKCRQNVLGEPEMNIHHLSDILIVDDSGAVRSVVRKLLTQLGFKNLDEASDGEAALAKLSEKSFGLVIADWNMKPMGGQLFTFEFTRK
jgi:CheY-like chemotaxis protein